MKLFEKNAKRRLFPKSDQMPFVRGGRFGALPHLQTIHKTEKKLSVFIAFIYVVDLFGVFPFLNLPATFIRCGFYAIPIVLILAGMQIYTAILLGRCWLIGEKINPSLMHKTRYPYAALSEMAYGRWSRIIVIVLQDISIFATGIPSILVASQNLQLFSYRVSDGQFHLSFCYWLIIIGICICPIMWLGSPKNMRQLVMVSVIVVCLAVICLWYCILSATVNTGTPFNDISRDLPSFLDILSAYSVMSFQFDIHPMLLTIQNDMQDKRQVSKATTFGIITTCTISIIGTIMAAYKFGIRVPKNILQILPKSPTLYAAILLISFQLCFSCAIGSSALFHHIENVFGIPQTFSYKRIILRSLIVGLEVLIAEIVSKFDVLIGFIGGTLTAPLIFILPPLLYTKIKNMEKIHNNITNQSLYGSLPLDLNFQRMDIADITETNSSRFEKLKKYSQFLYNDFSLPIVVMIVGIIGTFASTYLNIFKITQLMQLSSPCFSNVSSTFNGL